MASAFDYFGVFTGAASLYGAFLSWQQKKGAASERRSANEAVRKAERLVRVLTVQRVFAECIYRCRSAHTVLLDTPTIAADLIMEAAALIGLSGEPESKGRLTPASWRTMQQDLTELVVGVRQLGARVMPNAAKARASAVIMRIVGEMERVSAEVSASLGAQ